MIFVPERKNDPELLDMPAKSLDHAELAGSLADISLVNRYLGDLCAVRKYMTRMTAGMDKSDATLTVLDVATGSADIPIAIVDWARARGISAKVTAVDINPCAITIAREKTAGYPEISLAVADAHDLPYRDGSFDFVLCTKTLHHFSTSDAGEIVGRLSRLSRRGYIFIDIRRSWVAFSLIYILTRLFTRNRLTKNDGPLSVLRSFTVDEIAGLAKRGGLEGFRVERHPFWRVVLVGGKG